MKHLIDTIQNIANDQAQAHYDATGKATLARIANYSKYHNVSLDNAVTGYHNYCETYLNRTNKLLTAYTIFVAVGLAVTFILEFAI